MTTQLKPLFSLEIRHGYYGGVCGDVGFVVPRDVAQLMRSTGLLAKIIDGALHVFHRAAGADAGATARSAAGRTVRLGLQVQSPSFANITEDFDPGAGALYYRNGSAASALNAPTRVVLCGHVLSWPLARAARPVTVTLEDAAGYALPTETVTTENDRPDVSFDLTGVAPGVLTLKEAYASRVTRRTLYMDPELWREGVFGVAEIAVTPAFYKSAPSFTVALQARLETLRYYVVAKGLSNGDVDQLAVLDQGFGEPGHPDEVRFEKVPPEQLSADERSRTELLGRDGARVLLFRSLSAVTRRQIGRKRIQLMRNSEPLIENLPQPGRDRGTADLVVHLSKSKT